MLSINARRSLSVASFVALFAALAVAVGIQFAFRGRDLAPDFTLTDQNGQQFSLSAQRGKTVVLFFGYTHCPDECPLTLAHIALAIRSLGPAGHDVEPVFVTTDPARDSPPVLKAYLANFGPQFVGLTGSRAALAKAYTAYHVFTQKLPPQKGDDGYEMAHGTALYYITGGDRLRETNEWNDEPEAIAKIIKGLAG